MATYGNRTDLQNPTKKMAVTAVPGQTYGEAGAQRVAQQAVPMGTPQAPQIAPGSLGNLDQPSAICVLKISEHGCVAIVA